MDHILVVDDEKSIRYLIKDALEYYGYKVTAACCGQEGLEYFKDLDLLKLVITDIKMPNMDGVEFARALRNSNRPNIPIIAISAHAGNIATDKNLFNSVIEKPFNMLSLRKLIRTYLDS